MQPPSFGQFLAQVSERLISKNYSSTGPVPPLQAGFFKTGELDPPCAIGIKNAMTTTDSPAEIFQRTAKWFESLIGQSGGGLLVLVYYDTPVNVISEIAKVGNGFVVAGHYDLLTATHSIPTHLNWRGELLDR
jgi:hypothetical protein